MNIIEVAERRDEIMADQDVCCPICEVRQFSLFDKLFTRAYDECADCNSDVHEEYVRKGSNILEIIGEWNE